MLREFPLGLASSSAIPTGQTGNMVVTYVGLNPARLLALMLTVPGFDVVDVRIGSESQWRGNVNVPGEIFAPANREQAPQFDLEFDPADTLTITVYNRYAHGVPYCQGVLACIETRQAEIAAEPLSPPPAAPKSPAPKAKPAKIRNPVDPALPVEPQP